MTSSKGNIFSVAGPLWGDSPVTGEFPAQRPVTRSFDVFFDLRLNKRLSKQSWGWWFETPSRSLWRHCSVFIIENNVTFPRINRTWSLLMKLWQSTSSSPTHPSDYTRSQLTTQPSIHPSSSHSSNKQAIKSSIDSSDPPSIPPTHPRKKTSSYLVCDVHVMKKYVIYDWSYCDTKIYLCYECIDYSLCLKC